jgi:hypothetical protein
VHNSSLKIKRWCLKLLSDYPLVNLQFVRTSENLADFLTREGLLPGDFEKFNLKDLTIDDFYDQLPKTTFSLMEWINFVEENPQYLTVNYLSKSETPAIILSISKGLTNVKETLAPIDILRDKLSRSEIIKYQKN